MFRGRVKAGEQNENSRRGYHRAGRDVRNRRGKSNGDELHFAGNSSSTIFNAIFSEHADNFNVSGLQRNAALLRAQRHRTIFKFNSPRPNSVEGISHLLSVVQKPRHGKAEKIQRVFAVCRTHEQPIVRVSGIKRFVAAFFKQRVCFVEINFRQIFRVRR